MSCSISELFAFYLDAIASFLTSERPSLNVCFVGIRCWDKMQVYELLRNYNSVKLITIHPEFSQVTTMIMMVLDYLNAALELNSASGSTAADIVNCGVCVTCSIVTTMVCCPNW